MKNRIIFYPIMAALLLFISSNHVIGQTRYYVDTDVSASGDGLSWGTAKKFLQEAIYLAQEGDEIWVAEGTYYPDRDDSYPTGSGIRERCFEIGYSDIKLYGGFSGNETLLSQRSIEDNITILSGEIASPSIEDNSYHIIFLSNVHNLIENIINIEINGFTISNGYGNSPGPGGYGSEGAGIFIRLSYKGLFYFEL